MNNANSKSDKSIHCFTLIVKNKTGVHARPAAMIVRIASKYTGETWVTKDNERVNAKSIMGIMMLAAAKDSELSFECNDKNALRLENEMRDLFEARFQDE